MLVAFSGQGWPSHRRETFVTLSGLFAVIYKVKKRQSLTYNDYCTHVLLIALVIGSK